MLLKLKPVTQLKHEQLDTTANPLTPVTVSPVLAGNPGITVPNRVQSNKMAVALLTLTPVPLFSNAQALSVVLPEHIIPVWNPKIITCVKLLALAAAPIEIAGALEGPNVWKLRFWNVVAAFVVIRVCKLLVGVIITELAASPAIETPLTLTLIGPALLFSE